jgi:hypothetical protein
MRTVTARRLFSGALMAAALAVSTLANADEYDFAPAKAAISQLQQLPAAVVKVLAVVRTRNFGPFRIEDKCKIDSNCCRRGWCWVCQKDLSWDFPKYQWLKQTLDQRYSHVADVAGGFDAAFAPVKSWLTDSLPAFSKRFDDVTKPQLDKDTEVIGNAGSPADAVAKAKADITEQLAGISTSLSQGSGQLRQGIIALSGFNSQLNGALGQIDSASVRFGMERMISEDKTKLDQTRIPWCTLDKVKSDYNNIATTVRTQFQSVIDSANAFGIAATQTDTNVSLILGTVVNLQTRYQGALDHIKKAQLTPQGAVQNLRIDVAAAFWRDLALYAVAQLH